MNILLYAPSAREGGGITYVENLLKYAPNDHSLELYVLLPPGVGLPQDNRQIHRISTRLPLTNPLSRSICEKLFLPRILRTYSIDILFCPGGTVPPCPPEVATVATFQNMLPFDVKQRQRFPWGVARTKWWLLNKTFKRSLARADLLIFISEFGRQVIESQVPNRRGKSVVIPHGVDDRFRQDPSITQSMPQWLPEEGYILYVSAFDYYKSHVELVRAYGALRERREVQQKLVLIGNDRWGYGRSIHDEIQRLALQDDVVIHDAVPHEDLPPIYQHADLNIFPSECENCPFILLEMLASGRPLASSNRPPMPELAGDAAIYFDPRDQHSIADAMEQGLFDAETRDDLVHRTRRQAGLYEWQHAAHKTWSAITQLQRSNPSPIRRTLNSPSE